MLQFDKVVAELTLTLSKKARNFLGDFVYGKEDAYKNDLLHQLQTEVHRANGNLRKELTCVYDDTEKVLQGKNRSACFILSLVLYFGFCLPIV